MAFSMLNLLSFETILHLGPVKKYLPYRPGPFVRGLHGAETTYSPDTTNAPRLDHEQKYGGLSLNVFFYELNT